MLISPEIAITRATATIISSFEFVFPLASSSLFQQLNWPVTNVWVFIAQLLEHCGRNAEAMGLNPIEAPKIFSG